MKNHLIIITALLVAAWGCSKKESGSSSASSSSATGIDLSSSLEQIKATATKMDLASLEKTAQKYVDEINSKQAELEKLMEKFAAIPLAQKVGGEAQAIQKDILDLTNAISDLTSRLNVYLQAISEKGGDVSKFNIGNS